MCWRISFGKKHGWRMDLLSEDRTTDGDESTIDLRASVGRLDNVVGGQ